MFRRIFLSLFLIFPLYGCSSIKKPITLVPVNQPFAKLPLDTLEDGTPFPISDDTFSYDNSPEIKAALKEFSTSGKAPIVKRAGFLQFPFGEVQPILNCQPNYGCDIELQAGEKVSAVILGNDPLWDYLLWESNQNSTAISHITIGPRVNKAKTNVIIGTDRRTYHLELVSTKNSDYVRSAKFYYPRERLKELQAKQRRTNQLKAKKAKLDSLSKSLPYQVLNFNWEVEAKNSITWKPIRVFDDSAHIYIYFPEHVVFEDFPGVYTSTSEGKLSQPTWRSVAPDPERSDEKGSYLMVDGMFEELQLLGGFRGKQETVTITRKH